MVREIASNSAAVMVVLEDVSKRYGERRALLPTTLRLARGETTALVGTSGSGKSTLLRLVNGLIRPDSGKVVFDGVSSAEGSLALLRQRMGYVIQEGGLFPHLSARANVGLLARHLGWETTAIRQRIAELAELVRLPEALLGRFPGELSGGQRQRVSLMRALFLKPVLLLLDEPMGALDPITRTELQHDLRAMFAQLSTTTLLVTHDIAEAAYLAHTIVVMDGGAVVQRGSLRQLIERPASPFVERFVGAQVGAARALVEASS
jgi:osmoprotectant transport system ATP-binding protein